jgi:hypothetical protein
MNHVEFSNGFDVLYNNIMSNAAPGINEYEKSVLLTKAQDEILKNYFNPQGNKYQEGFDGSAKRQIDFSGLISVADCTSQSGAGFDLRAKIYRMPEDVFLIINETLTTNTGVKQVVPISFDEYSRLMSRLYKEPLKYQAWRLVTEGSGNENVIVEVIPHSGETVSKYTVRYVRRPKPIVLVDLASEYGDVSINGVSTISECELNPLIHEEILQRAVELAKIVYTGDANGLLQVGQRSE